MDVAAYFFAAERSEWGEPEWADTWCWWYVKICVKGDSGGMYVRRRLLMEEWQRSTEDGWEERKQL